MSSIKTLEREQRAVQLRRAKLTFADIGRELGVSSSGAYRIWQRAMTRIPAGQVAMMRLEEGDMLDRLHRAIWQQAASGDLSAIDRVIKLSEHRAKLFGLNAPVQVDATVRSKLDADLAELVDQLGALDPAPGEYAE